MNVNLDKSGETCRVSSMPTTTASTALNAVGLLVQTKRYLDDGTYSDSTYIQDRGIDDAEVPYWGVEETFEGWVDERDGTPFEVMAAARVDAIEALEKAEGNLLLAAEILIAEVES